MDDLLVRVLTRLLRVHEELGPKAFEQAAHHALVSIARSICITAEIDTGSADVDRAKVVPLHGDCRLPQDDGLPPNGA